MTADALWVTFVADLCTKNLRVLRRAILLVIFAIIAAVFGCRNAVLLWRLNCWQLDCFDLGALCDLYRVRSEKMVHALAVKVRLQLQLRCVCHA